MYRLTAKRTEIKRIGESPKCLHIRLLLPKIHYTRFPTLFITRSPSSHSLRCDCDYNFGVDLHQISNTTFPWAVILRFYFYAHLLRLELGVGKNTPDVHQEKNKCHFSNFELKIPKRINSIANSKTAISMTTDSRNVPA